ncbi:hypothetical protein OS493_015860 [Desmophyllum pertusum]|uniref:Uncharacterized protein n=1 Tax=Desmophyllum pertusum TaxID=174260 RepID=A0A9W9YCS0_9CNID|nr:hypothetical protein OS493_015860 [Desmophyllum pertusum]
MSRDMSKVTRSGFTENICSKVLDLMTLMLSSSNHDSYKSPDACRDHANLNNRILLIMKREIYDRNKVFYTYTNTFVYIYSRIIADCTYQVFVAISDHSKDNKQ